MRMPIIAANWKMNTTIAEATTLVQSMLGDLDQIQDIQKIICPPFISLAALTETVKGSSVELGAQNMHFEERGAFTGEISPLMLTGLCQYVIIGHSERRQHFHETGELINKKVKSALGHRLVPILCVGESLDDNEAGRTVELVTTQLDAALAEVDDLADTIVAYEPVWAIGSGRSASGGQANETIAIIRERLASLYGKGIADCTRILYGGSVTADNIADFVSQPEIDGALVGGASLKPEQFIGIVRQTAEIRGK